MLTGILLTYCAITLPLMAYIGRQVWLHMTKGVSNKPSILSQVVGAINGLHDPLVSWLVAIDNKLRVSEKDHQAMLQSCQAIAKTVLEIKKQMDEKPSKGSMGSFVNSLEYARDRFATTATQKRSISAIISKVITSHGTESK